MPESALHRHHRCLLFIMLCPLLGACGDVQPGFEVLAELSLGDDAVRVDALAGVDADKGSPIRVVLQRGDTERVLYEASIANADRRLSPDNVRPGIGPSSEVTLCLNGINQADVTVRIYPDTNTVIESDRACPP
ncbi:MAG: hypothetical protein AAGA61_02550 [Pseudomonadota bacterium]